LFYTGITKDLKRRVIEHNSGNGCKFTKYRAPVKLMHSEEAANRSLALKREAAIKHLPRKNKLALIRGQG
jgi:putative endonuclease